MMCASVYITENQQQADFYKKLQAGCAVAWHTGACPDQGDGDGRAGAACQQWCAWPVLMFLVLWRWSQPGTPSMRQAQHLDVTQE